MGVGNFVPLRLARGSPFPYATFVVHPLVLEAGRCIFTAMRYLVTARVKQGMDNALLRAIEDGSLGRGSVAGDEYAHNMNCARVRDDGSIRWVEVCFCSTPLAEERSYWEKFLELVEVRDAHARKNCRDLNGTEPWACCNCDCTQKLEGRLAGSDASFLDALRKQSKGGIS